MNNLYAIYDFILNELRKLTIKENFYFKPIKPKLSDLKLIAINISAEYLSIDSEHQLFRYLSNLKLNGMIKRSVYNRRRRKLFLRIEHIRIPDYINKSSNHKYVSSSVSESTIKIFPNPAKEKVNVSFNTGNKEEKAKQIQIFDARGTVKFVKELKSSSGELEIPIDNWLQGVYIVIVHTNGKALQGKLIKK